MVQRKTIWIAELDNDQKIVCTTKKEAQELEREEEREIEIEELEPVFEKYFKLYFGEKDRYNSYLYLCVDCGKKLMEWEAQWDGHRNNKGDCIFSEPAIQLFQGWRCPDCHKKAVDLFQKMLLFYNGGKSDIVNLIDVSEWKTIVNNKDTEKNLYIYRVADFWDKNHKKKKKKKK